MLSRIVRKVRKAVSTPPARAALCESLEQRQLLAVSPVVAGIKTKTKNLFTNGVSANQSVVTVPFTGNVNIIDKTKIQVRGYATNPINGHQKKIVVQVLDAVVLAADHKYIQITTDRLVRKGGKIYLYSGALTDDNGDTLADQTTACAQGQNKERFTLACRAWVPTDFTKFTPDLFTQSPTPTGAGTAPTDDSVTTAITNFLQSKVNKGIITATQRDAALARYNNSTAMIRFPDANLRAALVSLTGTFAEGAIASYLDGANLSGKPYTIVSFDVPPDPSTVVAQTIVRSDGRLRVVIKPEFKGEPFQVLSGYLAHEAIHQDGQLALQEEEVATISEVLVYGQQALVDSSFTSAGTTLIAGENDRLYALLESGRAIFPYPGLLAGPILHAATTGVFFGAKSQTGGAYTSFENYIKRFYLNRGAQSGTTPVNPLFKTYYTNITGKTAPTTLAFNDALITDIDSFQGIIGTKQAILLGGGLKLTVIS